MLPFRKSDSPFKSDPVSRVGSSTRLNQLGGPTSSNPATPQPYVTSSLNPSKNLPTNATNIKSKLQTQKDLDVFEQLPMVRQVKNYESLLDELSNDIAQFKDDELQLKIDQIIVCNDTLKKQIEDLNKHRNYSHQVDELSAKNKALENSSKTILKQLVNYRNELKKLPKIPKSDKQLNHNSVDVDDVLKYAFKLAKFTKAPATVANMPFQIHPNNYIWPAEDSLRRGMLAQASLQPDQIIQNELGVPTKKEEEEESEQKPESDEEMEDVINTTTHDEPQQQQRKSSHDGGFTTERKPEEPSAPTDLNLDLFDPDDEYSD